MRTFAQKPKNTQQNTSTKSTVPGQAHFGQSRGANSTFRLQRTIENQAVHRLLQSNAEELQPGSATTASKSFGHDFTGIPLHPPEPVLVERQRRTRVDSPFERLAQTSGRQLPDHLRKSWEVRLGSDLSFLRIHPDASPVAATGANAVTWGNDIFLRPGATDMHSPSGLELIGHELTHALQSRQHRGLRPWAAAEPALEAEARRIGAQLSAPGLAPLSVLQRGSPATLRGDKQVNFSGTDIHVSDTYVIHGPGATPDFLARFQSALNTYYNSPAIGYRGYNVHFHLSVRMARYDAEGDMIDSSWDAATKLFTVTTANGRAGGIGEITLYATSDEATIAHEVGHYLSNKIGYFSERYTENPLTRLGSILFGTASSSTPEPGCEDDIMATLSGRVTTCSLADFLDKEIDAHEAAVREEQRMERLMREGGYLGGGEYMRPGGIVVPIHPRP